MIVRRVPPDDVPPDGDREVMVVVGQEGVESAIEEPQLSTTIEVI